jgi:hypothetical protein
MKTQLVAEEVRRWKTRMPGDEVELSEWRGWWKEKIVPREVPLEEAPTIFIEFLEERLGTKRIHPVHSAAPHSTAPHSLTISRPSLCHPSHVFPPLFTLRSPTLRSRPSLRPPSRFIPPPFTIHSHIRHSRHSTALYSFPSLALYNAVLRCRPSLRRPSPFISALFSLQSSTLHSRPSLRRPSPIIPPLSTLNSSTLYSSTLHSCSKRLVGFVEVLSSNVRPRAEGRVIFRAEDRTSEARLSTKSCTQCCGEKLW